MSKIKTQHRRRKRLPRGSAAGAPIEPIEAVAARREPKLNQILRYLIWLYFLLLIFDGALRKWFLPGLSDLLLISRVPVTAAIYLLAIPARCFVINGFVAASVLLAGITFPLALITHGHPIVATYGLITNFFSIPLIFIIPKVFDYQETERMGRAILYLVIPMTILIAQQFYSPQSAWVNRSVGGVEGAGFSGALGRYRPPGTFSFITGVAQFYPLAFAFFLAQFVNQRTLPLWFLIPTGAAFVMATYGSISRLLALTELMVFVMCVVGLAINGRKIHNTFKLGVALIAFFGLASQFTYFSDGLETFMARWEAAKGGEDGTIKEAIFMRVINDFTHPFIYADHFDILGTGLGAGTNVGARFTTGAMGFTIAEGEWGRVIGELGFIFGLSYIAFRIALTIYIGYKAFTSLKRNNLLPWLTWGSCFMLVLSGQWGQQTTGGFAILSAGLVLAAGNPRNRPKSLT